jgi:hypothetical protein
VEEEATGATAADDDAGGAEAEATGATAAEEDAGVEETEAAGSDEGDAEVWFWLPLPALDPEGRPEDVTRSVSWAPAVIGPDGLAGQLPGGFRTCD